MTSSTDPRASRRDRTRAALKRISLTALSFFDHAIADGTALDTDPAAVPMLAHALRELTRILPRFTGLAATGGRVQYARDLDRIADLWANIDREARVLTVEQIAAVDSLIADHQASRIRAAARSMALARTYVHGVLQEEPLLEGLAQRWRDIERRIARLTHIRDDGSTGSPDETRDVLERYEVLLDQTLADFWDIDEQIAQALEPGPSAEALTAAKALPKSIQHWRRLYERLGPEWLPHVIAAGDFDQPPEWVTRAERPMAWPALDYLERVAAEEPTLAAEALLRIPAGIDQFAQAQVLEIAATLDADSVRPLAARARSWIRAARRTRD